MHNQEDETKDMKTSILTDAIRKAFVGTESARKEVYRIVTDQVKEFLHTLDWQGHLRKALDGVKIQVSAEISFQDTKTTVKTKVNKKHHA